MREWNLADLVKELQFIINANTGITDQAVTATSQDIDLHYRNAINEAYADEVEEAMQASDIRNFMTISKRTWPASQVTLDVSPLSEFVLFKAEDITDRDPGEALYINTWTARSTIFWKDRETLQWGANGPPSEKTIRFTHVEEPAQMLNDSDKPTMIPRRFRHLIAWSAAIILRIVMDDVATPPFVKRRNDIRMRFHKSLAMGKPIQTGYHGITNTDPDIHL